VSRKQNLGNRGNADASNLRRGRPDQDRPLSGSYGTHGRQPRYEGCGSVRAKIIDTSATLQSTQRFLSIDYLHALNAGVNV
jgi:hypothetical protein